MTLNVNDGEGSWLVAIAKNMGEALGRKAEKRCPALGCCAPLITPALYAGEMTGATSSAWTIGEPATFA